VSYARSGGEVARRRQPMATFRHSDRLRQYLENALKSYCQPAMPNGRCRVHGGLSTGPRTPEGLARSRRSNWKHGHYSKEARAARAEARVALRELRALLDRL
jgi:hypothetical protein